MTVRYALPNVHRSNVREEDVPQQYTDKHEHSTEPNDGCCDRFRNALIHPIQNFDRQVGMNDRQHREQIPNHKNTVATAPARR